MPTSVPKVLEKGMLLKVFYEIKITSQMQAVRTNTCLNKTKKKVLIIATINCSTIPFSGIIKFTDVKTLLLIGERDGIIWDFGTHWFGFSCSVGRLLY